MTAISPASGPTTGEVDVTITGENFVTGATVTIGGVQATDVVVVSARKITAKTPAFSAGSADVVVTNPDSQSGTLANGFTYISPAMPWDINSDGVVNVFDLVRVGSQFGQSGDHLSGDVNGDGTVDVLDLVLVCSHFGESTVAAAPFWDQGTRGNGIGRKADLP